MMGIIRVVTFARSVALIVKHVYSIVNVYHVLSHWHIQISYKNVKNVIMDTTLSLNGLIKNRYNSVNHFVEMAF